MNIPTAPAMAWLAWIHTLDRLDACKQLAIASPQQRHAYDACQALERAYDATPHRCLWWIPAVLLRDHSGPGYHRNPLGSYRYRGWIPLQLPDAEVLATWESIHGGSVPVDHRGCPVITLQELIGCLQQLGYLEVVA